MDQLNFLGGEPVVTNPFKDIRNTRPSTAEEKAHLHMTLGRLCKTPPPKVLNGSVRLTREWLQHQKAGLALAGNARASVPQLTAQIATLRSYL